MKIISISPDMFDYVSLAIIIYFEREIIVKINNAPHTASKQKLKCH